MREKNVKICDLKLLDNVNNVEKKKRVAKSIIYQTELSDFFDTT